MCLVESIELLTSGGPIAIGAVGGSGTRVVAQLLRDSGVFIGQNLIQALDDLWFTFFFKRPSWIKNFPCENEIEISLDLFLRASTVGLKGKISNSEEEYIAKIADELAKCPRTMGVDPSCAQEILQSTGRADNRIVDWGWKEPNTQIFLPELAKGLPGIKYVHVVRNGFDMAYSANKQQARNWSKKVLGLELQESDLSPARMLDFWIESNQRAIVQGKDILGDRFFLLSYEQLCDNPSKVVAHLSDFLDLPIQNKNLERLVNAKSRGRFKNYDFKVFSPKQKAAVEKIMRLSLVG